MAVKCGGRGFTSRAAGGRSITSDNEPPRLCQNLIRFSCEPSHIFFSVKDPPYSVIYWYLLFRCLGVGAGVTSRYQNS